MPRQILPALLRRDGWADTLGARASGPPVFTFHAPFSLKAALCRGMRTGGPRTQHPEASLLCSEFLSLGLGATFREDYCRLRVGDPTENMSTLHSDWYDFAKALGSLGGLLRRQNNIWRV